MQVKVSYTPIDTPITPVEPKELATHPQMNISNSSSDETLLIPSQPRLSVTRERKRMGWHLLLGTLIIVFISAGLSTLLILWIFWIHGVPSIPGKSIIAGVMQTGAFLVDEGTKKNEDGTERAKLVVLTISSVTTGAVAASAPILVMMAAYCTAGAWLAQQGQPSENGTNLPTPTQYGLLVKLSSTAGLVAMYDTARYLFVRGAQKRREPVPTLLPIAFIAVVIIYAITHLIAAADLFLHLTSSAILHNTTYPVDLSSSTPSFNPTLLAGVDNTYPFGIAFNDTLCSSPSFVSVPCLYQGPGWAGYIPTIAKSGMMIASNSTPVGLFNDNEPSPRHSLSVITLHDEDDLAVIVPSTSASMNSSLTWTGPTYGMRVNCRNLMPDCLTNDVDMATGGPVHNCSKAGYPYLPYDTNPRSSSNTSTSQLRSDSLIPGKVLMTANSTVISDIYAYLATGGEYLPNPHEVQIELVWPNTIDDSGGYNQLNTVVDVRALGDKATGFVACQVEYFNLTVRYDGPGMDGGRYSIVEGSMEPTEKEFMAIMAGPLWMSMINLQLHANLQARAMSDRNDDNVIAALNQEVSRLSLAIFAGSVVTQAPHSLSITKSAFVSRYPVTPVLVYTGLLYIYALIVLGIFAWASTIKTNLVRMVARNTETDSDYEMGGSREVTTLELAQNALTDPLVLVGLGVPRSLNGLHQMRSSQAGGRARPLLVDRMDMFGESGRVDGTLMEEGTLAGGHAGTSARTLRAPRLKLGIVAEGENAGLMFGVNEWRPKDLHDEGDRNV
ncbi:hypothetical protein BDN72DRAFT_589921 [Pluteus cervinus]|uniref:Uncharacterized protein n=1 Tax=Pluteus cervinus TaxID=181527 RepID=A0ACD3AWT4_9AGAR|nr:hypothetical protein BDN72DRAFT_589921 [Pluteus cervinus]